MVQSRSVPQLNFAVDTWNILRDWCHAGCILHGMCKLCYVLWDALQLRNLQINCRSLLMAVLWHMRNQVDMLQCLSCCSFAGPGVSRGMVWECESAMGCWPNDVPWCKPYVQFSAGATVECRACIARVSLCVREGLRACARARVCVCVCVCVCVRVCAHVWV